MLLSPTAQVRNTRTFVTLPPPMRWTKIGMATSCNMWSNSLGTPGSEITQPRPAGVFAQKTGRRAHGIFQCHRAFGNVRLSLVVIGHRSPKIAEPRRDLSLQFLAVNQLVPGCTRHALPRHVHRLSARCPRRSRSHLTDPTRCSRPRQCAPHCRPPWFCTTSPCQYRAVLWQTSRHWYRRSRRATTRCRFITISARMKTLLNPFGRNEILCYVQRSKSKAIKGKTQDVKGNRIRTRITTDERPKIKVTGC